MEFKKLQFKISDAQRIYENYLKQIKSATKKLPREDQQDILMELNSHIYESMAKKNPETGEVTNLLTVLDRIGVPDEVLKPLVAERKLNQAIRTFNPVHVIQALMLNLSYGITYIIFFISYLFIAAFSFLAVAKLFYPSSVGFYYKKGEIFRYGVFASNDNLQAFEVLGNWFIPVTVLFAFVFYFIITIFLKLNGSLKSVKNDRLGKHLSPDTTVEGHPIW
ncbi:hypothetical protein FPE01S_03_04720 [Flavihumibacter petaseus NBRC 106054]|uniref:DUF1700 domain-containing protein n=2 Tax=Flavihumibacter TaxID=1004301 RepID=A0A0E9N518_9BACT|nr:hypothetical protein FPE01S_03_04720 [Flavihumibacter petaseus NBRC 106054]